MLLQQTVHPTEQLFVGAFFSRGIGQVVAGAGRPCVGQKQLGAELLLQPAVELPVPPDQGIGHSGSVRQQHIAVPAAAVNQVGAGHAAPGQKLVQIVLHEQLQKERPAAQGAQGVFGMDSIKELLDAREISGIEQKSVLLAKILLLLKKCFAQVGDVVCLHIFADARRNGCGGLGVVKQGNIRAFAGKGAGRKTAELRFQQTQQRVDPLRLRLQIRQALAQLAHGICIDGSGKRLLLPWQLQTAVLRLRRHHPAGVGTVQVGEHRVQRKIPPEGTAFAFDLPAVCGGRKIICQINDIGRGIGRQRLCCTAQRGGVVVAHTVQRRCPACTGQNAVQKLVALFTVAAALPTGTVHRFAGVVQQPAIGGLQGENVQNTISFTGRGRIAQ